MYKEQTGPLINKLPKGLATKKGLGLGLGLGGPEQVVKLLRQGGAEGRDVK